MHQTNTINRTLRSLVLCFATMAAPVFGAPPANDNFASAEVIAGAGGFANGTLTEATREGAESALTNDFHTVWYQWVAPASGAVEFQTGGTTSYVPLKIYTGTQFANLQPVVQYGAFPPTRTAFVAVAGTTYQIQVSEFQTSPTPADNEFFLTWSAHPEGIVQLASDSFSGSEASEKVTVTLNRVGGSQGQVTVGLIAGAGDFGNLGFPGDTADPNTDYYSRNSFGSIVTFEDGETTKTADVEVRNDGFAEDTETFQVLLENGFFGNAVIGTASLATASIVDNDIGPAAGTFAFAQTYSVDGEFAREVTILRGGGSSGTASVTVDSTANHTGFNSTAAAGRDYTPIVGQVVNFADGETEKTFTVNILNESIVENDEDFAITLSNPTNGAALGQPAKHTLTIQNDDIAPSAGAISFGVTEESAQETGSFDVYLYRSGGTDGSVSVTVDSVNGTATGGSDFTAIVGQVVSFADGESFTILTITIADDVLMEADENFALVLSNPTGGAVLASPEVETITILNDDVAANGVIAFAAASSSTQESGTHTVTLSRTGGSDGMVTVDVFSISESAVSPGDFTALSETVTFQDGETSKPVSIAISPDAADEPDETFALSITSATGGATIGIQDSHTVTVLDDDIGAPANDHFGFAEALVTTGFSSGTTTGATAQVGEPQHAGAAARHSVWYSFTVPANNDYSIAVGPAPGLDPIGAVYTGSSVGALIPVTSKNTGGAGDGEVITGTNATSNAVTFFLAIDAAGATDGSFSIIFSVTPATGGGNAGAFRFASSTSTVAEDVAGGAHSITVQRTGGSTGAVSVQVSTVLVITGNDPATKGADYTFTNLTLSFASGETSKDITVGIIEDADVENIEIFSLGLSNPTGGATLANIATTHTVTLTDNDTEQPSTPVDAGYTGILNVDQASIGYGFIQLKTTAKQKVTGKLFVDGKSKPVKGTFDDQGVATIEYKSKSGGVTTTQTLTVRLREQAGTIDGDFEGYPITGTRNLTGTKKAPVAQSGYYTGRLAGTSIGAAAEVRGFFTISVAPTGKAKLAGALPDGTKLSFASNVVTGGGIPVAIGIYLEKLGYLLGDLAVSPGTRAISGDLAWYKASGNKLPLASVIGETLSADGLPYTKPAKNTRAIVGFDGNSGAALVDLTLGDLATDILAKPVSLDTKNMFRVTTPGSDSLALKVNSQLGLLTGSLIHTDGKKRKIAGILLQDSPAGVIEGFFPGTNLPGVVRITPAP